MACKQRHQHQRRTSMIAIPDTLAPWALFACERTSAFAFALLPSKMQMQTPKRIDQQGSQVEARAGNVNIAMFACMWYHEAKNMTMDG
mmetsp:Transcript_23618/g.65991  ORF Transcript_23618/g.65991 Transcript_23618/m.65991 type:complete len:88 (+) Transcript_23618:1956-2219(+)